MLLVKGLINVFSSYKVLNKESKSKGVAESTEAGNPIASPILARELSQQIQRLYNKFVNEKGVNPEILKSPEFAAYAKEARKLALVDLGALSEVERRVFAINLYNALMIHGLFEMGAPANAIAREKYFTECAYQIGPHVYSLNDIEHGLLRGNDGHPADPSSPVFSKNDPRAAFVLPKDARVHFALVCGAKSCPPIRFYTPENCEKGLTLAAEAFCRAHCTFVNDHTVETSMILSWYEKDFLPNQTEKLSSSDRKREVLKYMAQFLEDDEREKALTAVKRPDFTLTYEAYDWASNFTH